MTTAHEILQAAQKHMDDRASTYDKPEGERSMASTVEAFKAITGVTLTEEQGWMFMVVLKAVRSQQGGYRADSYEDGAAYFALAGEAAYVDRMPMEDVLKELRGVHGVDDLDEGPPWNNWDGKNENGPLTNKEVEVRFRRGLGRGAHASGFVSNFYWGHGSKDYDIIAYRIVK